MLSIRRFRQTDREPLRDLVLELHESMRPFDADLPPGDQIIERHFNDLMARVEQTAGAVFVAEDGGRMIGYLCLGTAR